MDSVETRTVETYCFIRNLDSSALLLNDWLKVHGFEFVEIDLLSFQNNFGLLVYFKPSKPDYFITMDCGLIDSDFFTLFQNSPFYEIKDVKKSPTVILLKLIQPYELSIINNVMPINGKHYEIMHKFTDTLIRKLRIFRSGNISSICSFDMDKDSRHIYMRAQGLEAKANIGLPESHLKIAVDEIPSIIEYLNTEITLNSLNEIAVLNFEGSYSIHNSKIRFITLMTSLESLFNFGKDQIAHTISRHLSIIISSNKNEFELNYKKIKKLYNKRNNIVHGSSETVSRDEVLEIENLVRKSILFTFSNSYKTKEDFFHFLNSKGFN